MVKRRKTVLLLILLYGLVSILWRLGFSGAYYEEAKNIMMGRRVIEGISCPECAAYPGSALIAPVLSALGDSIWGLYGARLVGIVFGLALALVLYLIASRLIGKGYGLLASAIFIFSGTGVYLSKLVTGDIISAFFLGAAFLCMTPGEEEMKNPGRRRLFLLLGAFALAFAAITKYLAALFIPGLLIYLFIRNKAREGFLYFLLPFFLLAGLYAYYALYPAREALTGQALWVYETSRLPIQTLLSWSLRWLMMPLLLSAFGIFSDERGGTALGLVLLSMPIIFLHLFFGGAQAGSRHAVYVYVFLAPAAAIGVSRMGDLFSVSSISNWVKPFFVGSVLVILWVFGIQDLRWLEKQYPDITPLTKYLERNAKSGMLVAVDSHHGQTLLDYTLSEKLPGAKFIQFGDMNGAYPRPDFIILDEYYGKKYLRPDILKYVRDGYTLGDELQMKLSWGIQKVEIYKKGGSAS
jgi:4-amino-4-deoxy-L-arabinose transferase-like glycosyltransferase